MEQTRIRVGAEPFSLAEEYAWLDACDEDGAIVTFTGKVRNHNLGDAVTTLALEHYPGMTENALADIVREARQRWPLQRVTVIHRVGELRTGERRGIHYGLSQDTGAVLEKGNHARRQPLGRRPRQRSAVGRALAHVMTT
jgi:molybdopterin synthase catalytic subunit